MLSTERICQHIIVAYTERTEVTNKERTEVDNNSNNNDIRIIGVDKTPGQNEGNDYNNHYEVNVTMTMSIITIPKLTMIIQLVSTISQ